MLKKLVIAFSLATLLAAPAFAQAYTPVYGSGNVINQPLAEQTNGAEGVGSSAYAPAHVRTPHHKSARTMH